MSDEFFKRLSEEEKPEYRRWARDNYSAGSEIEAHWHPVVREECRKMNDEEDVGLDCIRVTTNNEGEER
jgi:hypothetical protein